MYQSNYYTAENSLRLKLEELIGHSVDVSRKSILEMLPVMNIIQTLTPS